MPFLALSNANIRFSEWQLLWRAYTAGEALPATCRVEIINRKEFAAAAFGVLWCARDIFPLPRRLSQGPNGLAPCR